MIEFSKESLISVLRTIGFLVKELPNKVEFTFEDYKDCIFIHEHNLIPVEEVVYKLKNAKKYFGKINQPTEKINRAINILMTKEKRKVELEKSKINHL